MYSTFTGKVRIKFTDYNSVKSFKGLVTFPHHDCLKRSLCKNSKEEFEWHEDI